MKNEPKKINVCNDLECTQHKRYIVNIGESVYDFCCEQGFEKTMKEFNDFINKPNPKKDENG